MFFTQFMRKIDLIIIHCSATSEGKDFRTADIDRWHRQQGFKSIGYHFVVRLNGEVERGRPIAEVGAHCKGHNATSIGVCYIGGLAADGKRPKDTRTENQKKALKALLTLLRLRFPNAEIRGHRDYAAKDCPSRLTRLQNTRICNQSFSVISHLVIFDF